MGDPYGHRLPGVENKARRQGDVVLAQGGGHLGKRDLVGLKPVRVDGHSNLAVGFPGDLHLHDPVNILDPGKDQRLHQGAHHLDTFVRNDAELDYRELVGVEPAHLGPVRAVGEGEAVYRRLYDALRIGHIGAEPEGGQHNRIPFEAAGLDGLQPIDAGYRALDGLGYVLHHGFRVYRRIGGRHDHQGKLDFREKLHL